MKLGFFTLAICLVSTPLRAELRLASVITDHAVLQRDAPIHLWGEASPAEKIAVSFHGQSISTTANSLGLWEVWLKPEPAGGPFTLICWWAMCGLLPGNRTWKCPFPGFLRRPM
jgi:sialate O-acetylesterase